jgi:multisubunit Na+/H+ antiporter MnhG subunit
MNIVADFLIIAGCLIMLLCALGFLRSKDIFLSIKLVFISNVYGLSLLLTGFVLQKFNAALIIKIFILIALNIIITIIINHLIVKKAVADRKIIK